MTTNAGHSAAGEAPLAVALAAFVPAWQARYLAVRGELPRDPESESLWGALLFIDISGFTALTDRLAVAGPRGAEQMTELLDRHYGKLVDCIDEHGGDVIAFAGDAVLAMWWAEREDQLEDAATFAARCALRIQADNHLDAAVPGDALALRASLGAGPVRRYQLGGEGGRWHWLVAGRPFADVSAADKFTHPGQVLLTPSAAIRLRGALTVPEENGFARLLEFDCERVAACAHESGQALPEPHCLTAYVPDVVTERLAARQGDFIAEFRRVSVAFVNLAQDDDEDELEDLQRCLTTAQRIVDRYEGLLYQCLRDDKGLVLILAFGMPPRSHENDAERTVLAALALHAALPDRASSIGIASGRVFCGVYGGSARRQYSLVGSTMNLAARLMSAAGNGILCDAETAAAASARVALDERAPILAKGRQDRVAVYEPRGRKLPGSAAPLRKVVGRERELAILGTELERLVTPGTRRTAPLLIEAEAGIGKTTLAQTTVARAELLQITVLRGNADAVEADTPYYPFRAVFAQATARPGVTEAALRNAVAGSDLAHHLGLLAEIVPPHFGALDPVDDRLASGAIRLGKTNALLLELLGLATRGEPTLLLIEDAHWIDSASWSLLLEIANLMPNVALLVTTRPQHEPSPEFARIFGTPSAVRLRLESLAAAPLVELAAAALGVATLPATIADLLVERAGGNPFYAHELALALRDCGAIAIEDGRVRLASESAFDPGLLPETLQGVITSRIDALPAPVSLTAKVAAVVGHSFEADLVQAVHPHGGAGAAIASHLDALCAAELIEREQAGAAGHYRFHHAVIQQSVYAQLSYAQRRSLHAGAAVCLQQRSLAGDGRVLPRLAHHYSEAEMAPEALGALRAAGSQAVASFANREAVRFFNRALEIDATGKASLTVVDRVIVEAELSSAHYALTNYAQTLEHAWRAVRAGGLQPPRGGTLGVPFELAVLARDAARERLRSRRAPLLAGAAREQRLRCMNALATALPALMLLGRDVEYLESALKLHNLGAGLEPSAESGAARAALGLCFAMMGAPRRAERFLRRGHHECLAAGVPEHTISSHGLLGMFLLMRGELEQCCRHFEDALALIEERGDPGMWQHRVLLHYGTALDALGRTTEADATFVEAARVSLKVEPQVYGLMLSLRGATLLRAGRPGDAAPILLEGRERARDHQGALLSFAAQGAIAEFALCSGDRAGALEAARAARSETQKGSDVDSFVSGIQGYTGMCMVFIDCLQLAMSGAASPPIDRADALRHATSANARFRRFARTFVVARARYLALEGLRRHAIGDARGAARAWQEAEDIAARNRQPFELALVRYFQNCRLAGVAMHSWGPPP
jgi:class 3 adenylate cyclase/tetratricopeptide (TPR) repeat protein